MKNSRIMCLLLPEKCCLKERLLKEKFKRKERPVRSIIIFLMSFGIWVIEKCLRRFKFKMKFNRMPTKKLKKANNLPYKKMKKKKKTQTKKKKNCKKLKIIFHKQNGIKEWKKHLKEHCLRLYWKKISQWSLLIFKRY